MPYTQDQLKTALKEMTKKELFVERAKIMFMRWNECAPQSEDDERLRLEIDDIDHILHKRFGVFYPCSDPLYEAKIKEVYELSINESESGR